MQRTITVGLTIVVRAKDANSIEHLREAFQSAPRGERVPGMLKVQVGTSGITHSSASTGECWAPSVQCTERRAPRANLWPPSAERAEHRRVLSSERAEHQIGRAHV